jgi:hypothetical protein
VDGKAALVRKLLQILFPSASPVSVASPSISGDKEVLAVRVRNTAQMGPPSADRLNSEGRRVVIDAHVHQSFVSLDVINAVGNRLSFGVGRKVVGEDLGRLSRCMPLLSVVVEVAHQLLFLRVHRDSGITSFMEVTHGTIDVDELGITIVVMPAFERLLGGLHAVSFVP